MLLLVISSCESFFVRREAVGLKGSEAGLGHVWREWLRMMGPWECELIATSVEDVFEHGLYLGL